MGRYIKHYLKETHEGFDAMMKAGRHNPAWTVTFARKVITLSCGSGDMTAFWSLRDDTPLVKCHFLYCLSWNCSLGYVGLERFDLEDGSSCGDVFFQGYEQANEAFGEGWEDKSEGWLFKRCLEHID